MIDVEQHYRENFDRLVSVYSRRFGHHNAEDIVQEAYTRALTYLHTYHGPSFDAWLSKILFRCVSDCLREQSSGDVTLNEEMEQDFLVDVNTIGVVNELEIAVRTLISVKSPQEIAVLDHLLFKHMTIYNTAKECRCNPNAVWAILRKFKKELRESGIE